VKTKHVLVNNSKIGFLEQGKGSPILLIHGWSACKESFIPIIDKLKHKYRLIALDLPGYGDSEELKQEHNLDNTTTFLSNFTTALELKKVDLFGTSIGATLALLFALENHPQVNKLILQAPVYERAQLKGGRIMPRIFLNPFAYPVIKQLSKIAPIRDYYFDYHIKDRLNKKIPRVYDYVDPEYKQQAEVIINQVIDIFKNHTSNKSVVELGLSILKINTNITKNFTNKTLITWGDKDNLLDIEDGRKLHNQIQNSEIHPIKNSTHFMMLEKPLVLAEIIDNFLS